MDAISSARLVGLHPLLVDRYTRFDAQCEANGILLRITQGLRTWAEQDELFGQVPQVTKARGGYSAHNFGYALDVAPNDPAFPKWTPDWHTNDARWKQVLMLAQNYGLAEGAAWRSFPDFPHIYLAELPATPTDSMRELYAQGGIRAVWATCNFAPAELNLQGDA